MFQTFGKDNEVNRRYLNHDIGFLNDFAEGSFDEEQA
jgi:hypothetical protein